MSLAKFGYLLIGLLIVIALIFIGFGFGKDYTVRTLIPDMVASVDPFTYCYLHEKNNVTRMDITNIEDYAVDLYIRYKVYSKNNS